MTKPNPNGRRAQRDQFKPPKEPVEVACLHCLGVFMSNEMKYENRGVTLWWCPDENCDGAGFGFDLHETSEPFGANIANGRRAAMACA